MVCGERSDGHMGERSDGCVGGGVTVVWGREVRTKVGVLQRRGVSIV